MSMLYRLKVRQIILEIPHGKSCNIFAINLKVYFTIDVKCSVMPVTSGIPLLICKKYLVQFYAEFAQKLTCYALLMSFCEQVLWLVQDHFVCIYDNEQEWQFEKKHKKNANKF